MKRQSALGFGLVAAMFASMAAGTASAQDQRFVSVGTGGVTGVYYPVGGAICSLMNQTRRDHGIRCSVESTGGSVFNANAIKGGDLEFGIVQSDVQYNASKGEAGFADGGPHEKLRSVFSLHAEPLTVVARADANITDFDGLKGKRVNIGNPGSGQRALMDLLIAEKGWTNADFALAGELAPAEQSSQLCDNNIDAFAYTVGHPAGAIQEATTTCDSRIIPVEGEAVEKLVSERPYYFEAVIPGGMYNGNPDDVKTFGVGATVVTSADVPDDVVTAFVDAVFKDFDAFKSLHPALANLNPEDMANQGNSAPMHPAAEAYFKEKGWLN